LEDGDRSHEQPLGGVGSVKARKAGPLGQWIKWNTEPQTVLFDRIYTDGRETKTIATSSLLEGQEILTHWQYGDSVEPARYYVYQRVNERLSSHVSPVVWPFVDGEILFYPDCLLSAMYLLFALELSGRVRPSIICRGCGRYFTPVHGRQRYCDETCRKLDWYNRNKAKMTVRTTTVGEDRQHGKEAS